MSMNNVPTTKCSSPWFRTTPKWVCSSKRSAADPISKRGIKEPTSCLRIDVPFVLGITQCAMPLDMKIAGTLASKFALAKRQASLESGTKPAPMTTSWVPPSSGPEIGQIDETYSSA